LRTSDDDTEKAEGSELVGAGAVTDVGAVWGVVVATFVTGAVAILLAALVVDGVAPVATVLSFSVLCVPPLAVFTTPGRVGPMALTERLEYC
jgi:hypothetical protein